MNIYYVEVEITLGCHILTNIDTKLKRVLKNKTILITGGAGSLGSQLVKKLLQYPIHSIRVLDINEHALFTLNRSVNDNRLRLLLGNILDSDRLKMALFDVDFVFHTAAIKNIEISEFNPIETIETNINGTVNLIKSIIQSDVKKFLNISTDKAVEPSTLYGTTKQLGEKITSWAGTHTCPTKFSTVRMGNVFETRGNVFEIWEDEKNNNLPLSITDLSMERFFFHIDESVDFILECFLIMKSGEIFVPKIPLYKLKDLADDISKTHKIVGLRQGEKLKEILISDLEQKSSKSKKNMWIIYPYN
jgi:FlaA1/EpsC-like NDP-sugar epimerase